MADIEGGQPQHKSEEQRKGELELYKAAMGGDWSKAKEIFEKHGEQIKPSSRINAEGQTALHIATAADHFHFVQNLVDMMDNDDLAFRTEVAVSGGRSGSDESENPTQSTEEGNTAFFYAAASGNVKIAEIMLNKNSELATIRDRGNNLPIYTAALLGHYQMVRYLYDIDPKRARYTDDDYLSLLIALIDSDIYDVALQIVQEKKSLATKTGSNGETALHAFARKRYLPLNRSRAARLCLLILNILRKKKVQPKKESLQVVKLLWEEVILEDDKTISNLMNGKSGGLIFTAAKKGNYGFLTTLIRSYPDLVFKVDENNYTIFHIAVLHRRLQIFNLIHEIGSIKNFICMKIDGEGNNILHLAGKLPLTPNGIRHATVEAALQLQQELSWFKAVKTIVGPRQMKEENEKGKTPMELFEEEHEKLRQEGEKWMKNVAKSCMLVSTLVAAMVFAAAFALPGGVRQDNGIPILLKDKAFEIFAASDALSLIYSASSIFFFLSILTSSYSMDNFRISLHIKLILGLYVLFCSLIFMMMAFTSTFFIIYRHRTTISACEIAGFAVLCVLLFYVLVFRPLFARFKQPSSTLSGPNKRSLFLGTHEE